jgi:tRNA pseudouridine55 synthase
MWDGLVVVDKAPGWTSHDVVAKLRGVYGQKRVGHAGTLDPDATGVLLVGLGRVTRLLRYLQEAGKEYRGRVVFGVATDTLDGAGAVLERTEMSFTRAQLDAVARGFVGDIEQVPPMVSALKVGGRRLYELARAGEEVERAARPVHIGELVVEDLEPGAYPEATIRVACSSGTYIRTLAADLGAALGGPAHLGTLRRLRVGSFTLDEARPIESVAADPEAAVLAPAVAMRDLERVVVDGERARAVAHGATFAAPALVGGSEGAGPFAVVDEDHALLAVYERRGGGVKPSVVVVPEAAIS